MSVRPVQRSGDSAFLPADAEFDRRAAFEWCLIAVGLMVMLLCLPRELFHDDNVRLSDIETLLHHGHLTNSQYSLVMPLFSLPVLLLGEFIHSPAAWAVSVQHSGGCGRHHGGRTAQSPSPRGTPRPT